MGFPTPTDILITKTDFAMLLEYVEGMRMWIEAAAACMHHQRTFAEEINQFLRGAR